MRTIGMLDALLTAVIVVPLVAVAPVSVAAQDARQSADPGARIEAALSAALQARVPVALLESKVAEGKAKNVPAERIATAVEGKLSALIHAQDVLQRGGIVGVSAGELSIAADALQANVDAKAVVQVMKDAPPDRRAVATAVLTQLVQLGSASEAALLRVNTALTAGSNALADLLAETSAALLIRGDAPLIDASLSVESLIGLGLTRKN